MAEAIRGQSVCRGRRGGQGRRGDRASWACKGFFPDSRYQVLTGSPHTSEATIPARTPVRGTRPARSHTGTTWPGRTGQTGHPPAALLPPALEVHRCPQSQRSSSPLPTSPSCLGPPPSGHHRLRPQSEGLPSLPCLRPMKRRRQQLVGEPPTLLLGRTPSP